MPVLGFLSSPYEAQGPALAFAWQARASRSSDTPEFVYRFLKYNTLVTAPLNAIGGGSAAAACNNDATNAGDVLWRGQSLPGKHEPLVDELTFQRAQRLLRERGEDMALRRSNPGDYLLSGLVRCSRCKRAYVGMSARGNAGHYHYYACSGRQKLGRKGCDGERIPRDKLEAAVIHQLASLYRDGTLIREALGAATAKAQRKRPKLEEERRALADETRRAERALAATTPPSKPATSTPTASKNASPPSRRASTPSARKMPGSASNSRQKRTRRPTRPTSPASPTTSKPRSPPPTRAKRKPCSACSSKTCVSTADRKSCRPTASSQTRFAYCQVQWSEPASNLVGVCQCAGTEVHRGDQPSTPDWVLS
jgi:Recombinase zinc beta ribbon domain